MFAPCYVALDWASYIAPLGPFNITPWNPQPALALVWLLLGGLQHLPVVLATVFGAELLVRGAPAGSLITLATSTALTGTYGLVAWGLRAMGAFDWRLRSSRHLAVFMAAATAGATLAGALYVGILEAASLLATFSFVEAWLWFSIGEVVGILVTAPLLLVAADVSRRGDLGALARRPEAQAQALVLLAAIWLVFEGIPGDPARHFYLLFIPLIWIALRGGMNGAVIAIVIVQLGVVLAIHRHSAAALPVLELQGIVATLTLTGLFLGVMVDERQRAAEAYRQSLRFASAGEMAGALAHEVNQPLAAISNYAEAARMMVAGGADPAALDRAIESILGESRRAADVVRRLRDFFRTGATRLELMPVGELVDAIRRIGQQVIGEKAIQLEVNAPADLPPLYVDRVQIEMVLRNLIANALEAVQASADARIRVGAGLEGSAQVRLVVTDSGPGIAADARERIFEPFVSGKPTGLGLGLAISRAIAEAHGGSLDARAGHHGEFHLVLPCQAGA
jgi:two-component system sensor kinase FixL